MIKIEEAFACFADHRYLIEAWLQPWTPKKLLGVEAVLHAALLEYSELGRSSIGFPDCSLHKAKCGRKGALKSENLQNIRRL